MTVIIHEEYWNFEHKRVEICYDVADKGIFNQWLTIEMCDNGKIQIRESIDKEISLAVLKEFGKILMPRICYES